MHSLIDNAMRKSFYECVSRALTGRYRLATNTAVSCTILGSADAIQQLIMGTWEPMNSDRPWNYVRTGRFAAVGLVQGPMLHYLYRIIDLYIKFRGPKLAVVVQKCMIDISTAPAFSSSAICGVAMLEGKPLNEAMAEYRRKFAHIFMLDCMTWPPFQFINFWFLPHTYRVIYTNMIQLMYNIVISYIKHTHELGQPSSTIEM